MAIPRVGDRLWLYDYVRLFVVFIFTSCEGSFAPNNGTSLACRYSVELLLRQAPKNKGHGQIPLKVPNVKFDFDVRFLTYVSHR